MTLQQIRHNAKHVVLMCFLLHTCIPPRSLDTKANVSMFVCFSDKVISVTPVNAEQLAYLRLVESTAVSQVILYAMERYFRTFLIHVYQKTCSVVDWSYCHNVETITVIKVRLRLKALFFGVRFVLTMQYLCLH